jgi:hypothetical protein
VNQGASQSDQPSAEPLSVTAPAEMRIISPYECFRSLQWWKNATLISLLYARRCILPAGLWIGSLTIFLIPGIYVVNTLKGSVTSIQILQALVVYLLALFIAIPTLLWCFGTWLVRLTAFSRAFSDFSASEMIQSELDKARIIKAQNAALDGIKLKKVFLAKFWSTLTVFLLLPCIVFFVSMMVLSCTSSDILGQSALKLPVWALILTNVCCAVTALYTTLVSFVGLCVSANSDDDPVAGAKSVLNISFKHFVPLTVITVLSVLVSVLITSPHELFEGSQSMGKLSINVTWWSVVQELWRAASGTVAWTFTLTPICEFLRGKLDHTQ